jgi:hypothetical protein
MRAVVADVFNDAHFLQPVEHFVGAVLTVVGIDQEISDTAGAVMGYPFEKKGRLVSNCQDCQYFQVSKPAC